MKNQITKDLKARLREMGTKMAMTVIALSKTDIEVLLSQEIRIQIELQDFSIQLTLCNDVESQALAITPENCFEREIGSTKTGPILSKHGPKDSQNVTTRNDHQMRHPEDTKQPARLLKHSL
jgi:hypothetical protein